MFSVPKNDLQFVSFNWIISKIQLIEFFSFEKKKLKWKTKPKFCIQNYFRFNKNTYTM